MRIGFVVLLGFGIGAGSVTLLPEFTCSRGRSTDLSIALMAYPPLDSIAFIL